TRPSQLYAPSLRQLLHLLEAPLELFIGPLERPAGIDLELAGEVDDREQQIADFILDRFPFPLSRFPFRFPFPLSRFPLYLRDLFSSMVRVTDSASYASRSSPITIWNARWSSRSPSSSRSSAGLPFLRAWSTSRTSSTRYGRSVSGVWAPSQGQRARRSRTSASARARAASLGMGSPNRFIV